MERVGNIEVRGNGSGYSSGDYNGRASRGSKVGRVSRRSGVDRTW